MLHAILGELERSSGDVQMDGTLSYAAQSSYVMNMTLNDNILFGAEYNAELYHKVLYACALVVRVYNRCCLLCIYMPAIDMYIHAGD